MSDATVEAEAEAATERFRAAAGLHDDDGEESPASEKGSEGDASWTERALDAALDRPDAVGAAALALVEKPVDDLAALLAEAEPLIEEALATFSAVDRAA